MCEESQTSEATSLDSITDPAGFAPLPNPSVFSHSFVPYLEPVKANRYATLGNSEDTFDFKGEINNNSISEVPYPPGELKSCPEFNKCKEFVPCRLEEELFAGPQPENRFHGDFSNHHTPLSTNEHCYSSPNFKQYPGHNTHTKFSSNHGSTGANYFGNFYDNYCMPIPPYPTQENDYSAQVSDPDSSPWDMSGQRNAWKMSNRPAPIYSPLGSSPQFCPRTPFSPPPVLFFPSQLPSAPPKSHLNRTKKEVKSFSSPFPLRNKRGGAMSKRSFTNPVFPLRAKETSQSMTLFHKLKRGDSVPPYPHETSKSPGDLKSLSFGPPSSKDQALTDSRSKNSTAPINYTKTKETSGDTSSTSRSASASASGDAVPQAGETKSPTITNSLWKQVDDVIEEILNLEEGLETGGNLKKADAQGAPIPASQGDNVPGTICDLLGLNGFIGGKTSSASSCPSDVPKIKKEPPSNSDPQVVAFMKDRQKKDNHNMIERRRRFNINDRIRDLSQLLPKTNEPYHEIVRDIRHNKGQILRASVDYIRRLKSDLEVSKGAEDKRRALEQQNRQLLLRVQELEAQLRMNGIKVEETKFNSNLLLPSMAQSEVMSPTSTTVSPTTSPFSPTPTISPFTSIANHTTSSPLNPINTGNFTATTTTTCSSGSDLADFNLCEEPSMISGHGNNLLTDLGVPDEATDTKKVKCPAPHLPDFLLEDLLMADFPTENFGINLMDDDSLAFTSDPMFSSPQVSSPNSSRHSFEDALTPDSMDIVS